MSKTYSSREYRVFSIKRPTKSPSLIPRERIKDFAFIWLIHNESAKKWQWLSLALIHFTVSCLHRFLLAQHSCPLLFYQVSHVYLNLVFIGDFDRTPLGIVISSITRCNVSLSFILFEKFCYWLSVSSEAQLPEETKKEALPVEQLPLESKMQQIMEQKMKMKLAKKIRLPRKRLVCKRKMREKGRWPPSKMKKLKNV
ncbi:50S ribosomal 5, chloroplastic [Gossypium arboreum]|uniref:50S ribosomal 5, chloroplastic n=1 Tax=Gossypium arboreum TaxID=29729 RepID=A0A0B0N6F1_GOSAR|nr:50S ribosomal 5, chloroplastic [Gossypium arboreum]